MAGKRDAYEILGVNKDDDYDSVIKGAFRKLAMKYHPDRNQGNEEAEQKFKEINAANEVLKDPQLRKKYDRGGWKALEEDDSVDINFADVFGSPEEQAEAFGTTLDDDGAFDRMRQRMAARKKQKSAGNGKTTAGAGAAKPASPAPKQNTTSAAQESMQTMPLSVGLAELYAGKVRVTLSVSGEFNGKSFNLPVSAATQSGKKLKVSQFDVILDVTVEEHDVFERNGADIACRIAVPMAVAALGGEVPVPTLDGENIVIELPEGTDSGTVLTLEGYGLPEGKNGPRGDLYVECVVETPKNLNAEQRTLLEAFVENLEGAETGVAVISRNGAKAPKFNAA